jgi:hypothetical protein
MFKPKNIAIATIALVAMVSFGFVALDWFDNPRVLRTNLKIAALPDSVKSLRCETGPITDVLVDCSFTIDPNEFPKLLTGWSFREHRYEGQYPGQVITFLKDLGFPVAVVFEADISTDSDFTHGGFFLIYADAARSRVHTKLYIE